MDVLPYMLIDPVPRRRRPAAPWCGVVAALKSFCQVSSSREGLTTWAYDPGRIGFSSP